MEDIVQDQRVPCGSITIQQRLSSFRIGWTWTTFTTELGHDLRAFLVSESRPDFLVCRLSDHGSESGLSSLVNSRDSVNIHDSSLDAGSSFRPFSADTLLRSGLSGARSTSELFLSPAH